MVARLMCDIFIIPQSTAKYRKRGRPQSGNTYRICRVSLRKRGSGIPMPGEL